jgi:LysR family glycine cleavage system transcriptional activator
MTKFPPIAALRALEAAARHLSYTKAAQELHITQSAVSHQIHHAEELWGLKLFERRGRRLILTDNGQALVPIVRDFLDRISATVRDLKSEEKRYSLRISLLQSFALKWLVPRLGDFNQKHPDIEVWLSTTDELVDLGNGSADIAIRLGQGNWANLHSVLLLREHVFPVCSPSFLQSYGTPKTPSDLLQYPLLRRYSMDITPRWDDWFRAAGVRVGNMPTGTKLSDTSMAVQAALDDQGIALARSAHVSDDLAAGRLIKLFNVDCRSNVAYYIVCLQGRENEPSIKAFRDWLLAKARIAQTEFDAIVSDSKAK